MLINLMKNQLAYVLSQSVAVVLTYHLPIQLSNFF